jgi:hypothetical protein
MLEGTGTGAAAFSIVVVPFVFVTMSAARTPAVPDAKLPALIQE